MDFPVYFLRWPKFWVTIQQYIAPFGVSGSQFTMAATDIMAHGPVISVYGLPTLPLFWSNWHAGTISIHKLPRPVENPPDHIHWAHMKTLMHDLLCHINSVLTNFPVVLFTPTSILYTIVS